MGHKGRTVKSHVLSQQCDIIFPLKHQKTHISSKNLENRTKLQNKLQYKLQNKIKIQKKKDLIFFL